MKGSSWRHDDLAHDLAVKQANGNKVVFENIPMGPSGSERPDVYVIEKSFVHPRPTTYEIKVSVADLASDLRNEKWKSYRPYSEFIYFAVPEDLDVRKDQVPADCGLIVRKKKIWKIAKYPYGNRIKNMPMDVVTKLLIATHDGTRCTDRGYRRHLENRHKAIEHIGKLMGAEIASGCEEHLRTSHLLEIERHQNAKVRREIAEILGNKTMWWNEIIRTLKKDDS